MKLETAVGAPAQLRVGSTVTLFKDGGTAWEVTGKAAVVLAWVALEGHAERRRLAALLWPASDAGQARSNLRVLVHRINQRWGAELLLGAEQLTLDASQVQLELHDSATVLKALRSGGAQRCELLAASGLGADTGEELQAWLAEARQRLKRVQLASLSEALAEALADARADARAGARAGAATGARAGARHEPAVVLARACVQLDPLSEQRHRQLMDVLVQGGDRAAALAAYEECKGVLRQHLGVLPDLQTRTVQLRILQQQAQTPAQGPAQAAQQTPEADGLTLLGGAARYPLLEREAVLGQAQAALKQGVHVVLQGEPGVGKTRLLRHLAAAGDGIESVAIRSGLKQEPYAAVAQLLQEVHPRRAPRTGVPEQIELARLAPLAFAGVRPSEAALSAARLHAALRHWVARLGQAGVRVLVLDDVQHADAASQAAFAALLQATPEAAEHGPVLLLGHRSEEIEAALDDAVTEAQARHRALRIELPRLTLAGVKSLLKAMDAAQRTHEPDALALLLLKRTGGNPLFVIELAQQTLEQGVAADIASLQALLGSRLKACSSAAQQLAAVAAVAAQDFTVELATALTGQPALALMPAWSELQQRGLFAGHGLAHGLVQDAVLAGLPQAIRQRLHRQVAQHLESQGLQGAAVLRHWLAANDADRALPHAEIHLQAVSAAGLPTELQEVELLGLLERCSDSVLTANLWLTAEIDGTLNLATASAETWLRLRALRHRVERLSEPGSRAGWIAYETARDRFHIEKSVKTAYEGLVPAVDRMPQQGVERASAEYLLMALAFLLTGDPQEHLHRAKSALEGLAEKLSLMRLRTVINGFSAAFLDPVELIRSQAARRRTGRRRGDLALVSEASGQLAGGYAAIGNHARAFAHLRLAARAQPGDGDAPDRFHRPFDVGTLGLSAGHYDLAQRLMAANDQSEAREVRPLFLALLQLRLGNLCQARMHADRVDPGSLLQWSSLLLLHATVSAELDNSDGRDPEPALRQQLQRMRELGIGGINLDLMAWEIRLWTVPAVERLDEGEALLAMLQHKKSSGGKIVRVLLEVAEARAQVGAAGSVKLATEAAQLLRRGYSPYTLYVPEGLVRCARLIVGSDPRGAAALVHVARRWVRNVLPGLPQGTEHSFVQNVVVNRLLLGEDEQALYTEPLR